MRSAFAAVGIFLVSCLAGGTIGNLWFIVGDSLARGSRLPPDWLIGVFGFNIFSLPYAVIGLLPVVVAALSLWFFTNVSRPMLILSMAILGMVIGEWITSDNLWKNYRYLHFGAVAGATTAALWTWLTFRQRTTPARA